MYTQTLRFMGMNIYGLQKRSFIYMKLSGISRGVDSALLMIPKGKTYLVGPLNFKGPCRNNLVVQVGR